MDNALDSQALSRIVSEESHDFAVSDFRYEYSVKQVKTEPVQITENQVLETLDTSLNNCGAAIACRSDRVVLGGCSDPTGERINTPASETQDFAGFVKNSYFLEEGRGYSKDEVEQEENNACGRSKEQAVQEITLSSNGSEGVQEQPAEHKDGTEGSVTEKPVAQEQNSDKGEGGEALIKGLGWKEVLSWQDTKEQ